MVGLLMVLPLLPFYAKRFVGEGPLWRLLDMLGMGGEGSVIALMVSSFAIAQLLSAPMWGRVSAGSYTHLTPPTSDLVEISVGAVSLKHK